jgi:DNA-binding NtrC family response regulator
VESEIADNGSLKTLDEVQRQYIQRVLQHEGGRVESAARRLGIPRSSLYNKLKQYHIGKPSIGAMQ